MHPFPTSNVTLYGSAHAETVVVHLLRNSQWFTLTPLPNDAYALTVKREAHQTVQQVADNALHLQLATPITGQGPAITYVHVGDETADATPVDSDGGSSD
jgi:hypothetical protein